MSKLVADTGHHEGVLVGEQVYDNMLPIGVPKRTWGEIYLVYSPFGIAPIRQAHEIGVGTITPWDTPPGTWIGPPPNMR